MNLDWLPGDPMNMRGPQFLAFYAAVVASATVLTWWLRKHLEGGAVPRLEQTDPYQIAFLRGGPDEVLRIALFQLLDREALATQGGMIGPGPNAGQPAKDPIEQSVLSHFSVRGQPKTLFEAGRSRWIRGQFEPGLVQLGLLPGSADRKRRWQIAATVIFGLLGLAAAKFAIGISRDKPVSFLIILSLIGTSIAILPLLRRRTARGDELVRDLKQIFSGIRETSLHRGAPDASLAVAVFGLALLPESIWPWRKEIFPQASGSGACGSGCGSGCGGGGCGGGGCGGCGGD